jgi:hypothetical protein
MGLFQVSRLLHHRLGFHSGMLALAALVDHGVGQGRLGSLINLSSACLCLCFGAWRLKQAIHAPSARNLFWPICLLLLASGLETTLISTYPDTLLALLVPATFWMAWGWWQRGLKPQASWPILLLGAGALAVKGFGVFLLIPVLCLSVLFAGRISLAAVLKRALVSVLLISPVLAVQAVTTGDPLYPMVAFAVPVSWAAPDSVVISARETIQNFPLFAYAQPHALSIWDRARILLLGPRPSLYGATAITLFSIWLCWRERRSNFAGILALAFSTIAIIQLMEIPAARFSWGFLVILPALMGAYHSRTWIPATFLAAMLLLYVSEPTSNRLDQLRLLVYAGVLIAVSVAFRFKLPLPARALLGVLIAFQFIRPMATSARKLTAAIREPSLLIAPEPVSAVIDDSSAMARSGEVIYREAQNGFHCWDQAPPCAPSRYQSNFFAVVGLHYRCADRRLSCGFIMGK